MFYYRFKGVCVLLLQSARFAAPLTCARALCLDRRACEHTATEQDMEVRASYSQLLFIDRRTRRCVDYAVLPLFTSIACVRATCRFSQSVRSFSVGLSSRLAQVCPNFSPPIA